MTFSSVSPESQGVPAAAVAAFLEGLKELALPMHSVLLVRRGALLAEYYAEPYPADVPHRIYSASKSFVALAVGLLVGEGKLSVRDRLAVYFPEKVPLDADALVLETTVEDLLRMAPPFSDESYDSLKGDVVESFFRAETTHPAGTIFCYNAASPAVLTALVEKLAGEPMLSYMWPRLLKPLGFSPRTWCVKMPQGLSWGASGIMCTPRDLAKLGVLLLNKGVWEGRRLLPEEYVRAACGRQLDSDAENTGTESGFGYGYLIWRTRHSGFAFCGMGSQYLVCLPKEELVLVTTGDTQAVRGGSDALLNCFWRTVYASLQPNGTALTSEARPAAERLALPLPFSDGSSGPPEGIWGRRAVMRENSMGISWMCFEREEDSILWRYENRTGEHQLRFGVGCYREQTFPETHYYIDTVGRPGGRGYRCQAGAVWSCAGTLAARVYITDVNVGTGKMTFRFGRDCVSVWMTACAEFFLTEYRGFGWGCFSAD